ncbi:MAG: DUF5329 family protein [Casimicrobiaceae bacterium]
MTPSRTYLPDRSASMRWFVAAAAIVAVSTLTVAPIAQATPDARASAEIEQLLGAIDHSGCTFVRSGEEYTGAQARRHLELKLGFARSRIDSADQFVRDLASASSTTGEAYRIRCGRDESAARTWLESRLRSIRSLR